ncbi:hypothetical protein P7C73_g1375, partial [Tremellales sp. Uapishka_1]
MNPSYPNDTHHPAARATIPELPYPSLLSYNDYLRTRGRYPMTSDANTSECEGDGDDLPYLDIPPTPTYPPALPEITLADHVGMGALLGRSTLIQTTVHQTRKVHLHPGASLRDQTSLSAPYLPPSTVAIDPLPSLAFNSKTSALTTVEEVVQEEKLRRVYRFQRDFIRLAERFYDDLSALITDTPADVLHESVDAPLWVSGVSKRIPDIFTDIQHSCSGIFPQPLRHQAPPSPSSPPSPASPPSPPNTEDPLSPTLMPVPPSVIHGSWQPIEVNRLRHLHLTAPKTAAGTTDWNWIVQHLGKVRTRHQVLIKAVELGLRKSSTAPSRKAKQRSKTALVRERQECVGAGPVNI